MKKMNKMYEAPVAEMIEMQMPVVLQLSSGDQNTAVDPTNNTNDPGIPGLS
jgi:hypothetical protein